jgi:hypothetical protein
MAEARRRRGGRLLRWASPTRSISIYCGQSRMDGCESLRCYALDTSGGAWMARAMTGMRFTADQPMARASIALRRGGAPPWHSPTRSISIYCALDKGGWMAARWIPIRLPGPGRRTRPAPATRRGAGGRGGGGSGGGGGGAAAARRRPAPSVAQHGAQYGILLRAGPRRTDGSGNHRRALHSPAGSCRRSRSALTTTRWTRVREDGWLGQ